MKTFTFVFKENNKHYFVHQCQSETLTKDLLFKLIHESIHISSKIKSLLIDDIIEWYDPVRLDRVKNVWRKSFLIDDLKSLYNEDVAKKYHEGCGDDKYYKLMYEYDVHMIETDMSDTMFPQSEKVTFTFMTYLQNYKGPFQFEANTLEEGLMLWATKIDILNHQRQEIFCLRKIQD